jgi:hypothetical protein
VSPETGTGITLVASQANVEQRIHGLVWRRGRMDCKESLSGQLENVQ